jgi:hypothetical protein
MMSYQSLKRFSPSIIAKSKNILNKPHIIGMTETNGVTFDWVSVYFHVDEINQRTVTEITKNTKILNLYIETEDYRESDPTN